MSTEEEYKELSAKLRYGLELAEQRLIEETARREGTLCYGRPDGKVVRISATELLKLRQSGISLKIILPNTKKPLFSKKEGFKLYKISQITY
jgi:hypothetical protein